LSGPQQSIYLILKPIFKLASLDPIIIITIDHSIHINVRITNCVNVTGFINIDIMKIIRIMKFDQI